MCKVSVCIPTYNSGPLFKKTLDSLIRQKGIEDFEIVITDDSIDDFVLNTINSCDFKGRLSYHRNSPPLGSPGNWNKTIALAKGEYIKVLHHDDWLTSETSLASYVNMLDENEDCDFAFSSSLNVKEGHIASINSPDYDFVSQVQQNPGMLFLGNRIGAPSATIVRRKGIPRFDTKLKWLVDVEWYIQILQKNTRIIHCEQCLVSIGIHEMQTTNSCLGNPDVELKENFYVFRKHLLKNASRKAFIEYLNETLKRLKIHSFRQFRNYTDLSLFQCRFYIRTLISNKLKRLKGRL